MTPGKRWPFLLARISLGAAFGSLALLAITPLRDYSPVPLTMVHFLLGAIIFGGYLGVWMVEAEGTSAHAVRRFLAAVGLPVSVAIGVVLAGSYYMLWRVGLAGVYDIAFAWFERIIVVSALTGLVTVGFGFAIGAFAAFYRQN